MKRFALVLSVLALFVASFALPVVAQDDDMMDAHVCDSTTILLLFIAEYDFDFVSMMDASTFDKGQYAPLFEAMMMMDEEMMDDDDMMDDEAMIDDDAMMMDDEMMTMLELPVIADEDPACTELRAELDGFFYDYFFGMMDDMEESDG